MVMLKKILIGLAVIIVGLLVVVAVQPSQFQVTRTATISAPPPAVFEQVNDLHHWQAWSPWGKIDPTMKETFAGAPAGVGAIYTWSGNSQVGEGRMTITESRPSDLIRLKLEFIRPFAGLCAVEFTFKPEGDHTAVAWSMDGKNNFIAKAVGLFVNCDKMIGGQFEQGLAQMKTVAETANKK
jgi:uncharacterized protein YndB with AHSA1/START domain